jgi:hypothetical protein
MTCNDGGITDVEESEIEDALEVPGL